MGEELPDLVYVADPFGAPRSVVAGIRGNSLNAGETCAASAALGRFATGSPLRFQTSREIEVVGDQVRILVCRIPGSLLGQSAHRR